MGNIFTELTPELVRLVGVHLNVFILVLVGHPRLFPPRSQLNGDGLTKVLLVHLEIFILTTKSLWPVGGWRCGVGLNNLHLKGELQLTWVVLLDPNQGVEVLCRMQSQTLLLLHVHIFIV